ncbi:rpsU-divergently transcribed protein [Asticcacaulis biprosthecium C19]|uniref:RpsU-divergently transcribed protein n=1 Tax=Asticcacaulis biprosthecium C19 TaxID=715226 RepID=F4QPU3_9CAUL|nr:COQ9 family protein [Asticcacaulis biprosthecium]EGF90230.1 rpsU-divergently transcribed protein [Asticcacaulis biprosthecium C19]
MSAHTPFSDLKEAEYRLAQAVAPFVPDMGLNRGSVEAGAQALNMDEGLRDLIAPNGASDIAAILWRGHDAALDDAVVDGLKIREKIAHLLNLRLDAAATDERLARRLMGFFALPHHAALFHRLLWATADSIWRLAGDKALDENHYSKRIIVCGILSTALMTRLSQGRDAQLDQIRRNIESVMAYEKFKANLPAKPEEVVLDLAQTLGRLRFGHEAPL